MIVVVEGQKDVLKALGEVEERLVRKAAREGLIKAGRDIVKDAQYNLRDERINTTGRLSRSGKVEEQRDGTIHAGFMSGEQNYAGAVEYGRRAGKMPPIWALQEWAYKKLRLSREEANKAGYGLARNIGKRGTKPHPFFAPAVKKNQAQVVKALKEAIAKVIK